MNREWELGARSIISSDSIIQGSKASCILNNLDGREDDVLREAVLDDSSGGSGGVRDTKVKDACEENEYNCFMN